MIQIEKYKTKKHEWCDLLPNRFPSFSAGNVLDHYHQLDCQFITLFCVKKIWNSYERKFEFLRNYCLVCKFRHGIFNFINVLRAHFLYKSLWAAFFYLLFDFEFLVPIFCTKNVHVKCGWNWLLMFLVKIAKRLSRLKI